MGPTKVVLTVPVVPYIETSWYFLSYISSDGWLITKQAF
jgi:hypothetical protein